jgi:chromosome segregation ATPase
MSTDEEIDMLKKEIDKLNKTKENRIKSLQENEDNELDEGVVLLEDEIKQIKEKIKELQIQKEKHEENKEEENFS